MINEIWNRENIPDSYIAEDGLLHCSLCGGPLEVRLSEYNVFLNLISDQAHVDVARRRSKGSVKNMSGGSI